MRLLRRTAAPAEEPAAPDEAGTGGEPTAAERPARRGAGSRTGGAVTGAAVASTAAVGTLVVMLARLIRIVAGLICLLIVLGIILYDLKANGSNSIVKGIHDAANFFASPFNGIFTPKNPRVRLTINWGIAAAVYIIAGSIIASILARPGHGLRERTAPRG